MSIAVLYFPRYGHLKILQIWLKMPIPTPKIYVLGGFCPPNIIFRHWHPQKAVPWPKLLLSIKIGPGVSPGRRDKYTKKTKGSPERSRETRGVGPAHALNPILTIFGMWGLPGCDSKIWVSGRSVPKFSSYGGRGQKSPISYSSHIAYTTVLRYRVHCDHFVPRHVADNFTACR